MNTFLTKQSAYGQEQLFISTFFIFTRLPKPWKVSKKWKFKMAFAMKGGGGTGGYTRGGGRPITIFRFHQGPYARFQQIVLLKLL